MRLVHYDVVLEVRTPLHIGTGQELYPDADFVAEEGPSRQRLVRVIDIDAALLDMTPEEIAAIRDGRVAAALGQRRRERHTRALLPAKGPGNVARTRAMQRLPDGRPYIPGTTVKGSIRTALLQALADGGLLRQLPAAGTREKGAALHVEERAFSVPLQTPEDGNVQFANRDLNRLIRVSDFLPDGRVPVALVNMSAYRLGRESARSGSPIPIWCEAIEPGARFKGTITLEMDSPVWNAMASGQRDAVHRLFTTWYQAGRRLLLAEQQAWATGPADIRDSVRRFIDDALERREVYVNLGWGGGWKTKTLGDLIPKDRLQAIAQRYGLSRWQGRDFPAQFPVTRKVAYGPNGPVPPGWVRVLRRPRDQAREA